MTSKRVTLLGLVGMASFVMGVVSACNGSDDATPSNGSSSGGGPTASGDRCAHPNPGCACTDVGAQADCGKVELTIGTFVQCSMGKTTCDGEKWGECLGDTILAKSFQGGGLHLQSLAALPANCTNDPCDPYCQAFNDTAAGIDASGFGSNDGGLFLPPGANACQCEQPSNPGALYTNIANANKGNPGSCSGNDAGTATDNCNHDYQCVGGTCQPYAIAGVNPACGSSADYTLGLGCNDGPGWVLQVCNRGLVPTPGLGTLQIAITDGSPSTAPGACTTGATGASWPTGPTIAGASVNKGKCAINLASTPIGPGQCINVDVGTQCTQLDGVTPLNAIDATRLWATVNPSTAILPGATPVNECDTCNNYTALEKNAIPPLLGNAASCATSTCGTVCGGASDAGTDGGSGCHTYVTGTVYDPGGNIPLPGIAIYEPTAAALPSFAGGVSCDTCASVLPTPANLVATTYSAIDGAFALEVDGTTNIPVVFQTGRWRRKITIGVDTPALTACAVNNITVPADCWQPGADAQHPGAWPATNCKTRLPQTSAEGDIPLLAFVTGSAEPFQCSFAQFMGGASEIGIGGGKRIQLYHANGEDRRNVTGTRTGTAAVVAAPPAMLSGAGWIDTAGPSQTFDQLSDIDTGGSRQSTAAASAVSPYPQNVTNLGGITAAYTGGILTMWGSKSTTNPTNNGNWPITVAGANNATFLHQNGKADGNNGSTNFRWYATGPTGSLTAAFINGTITTDGGSDEFNNNTFTIVSVPTNKSVTVSNPDGTLDGNNGRGGTWNVIAPPGYVTITGLTGMTAADVGGSITFSNGPSAKAANRGTYKIYKVLSPTSIGVLNFNAVVDTSATLRWSAPPTTPIPDAEDNLWDSQAHLNAYDEVILGCTGGTADATETGGIGNGTRAASQGYFYNYLKGGGRLFANHYSPSGILMPSTMQGHAVPPWSSTSTYIGWGNKVLLHGRVKPSGTPTIPHSNFKSWLQAQGAYAGGGVATPQAVENEFINPDATNSFEWLRASDTGGSDDFVGQPNGNMSLVYSFDSNATGIVPTLAADGGAGAGCGRTVLSAMHVDITRGSTSGGFPNVCTLGGSLSPNEAAFEYLLFILSSCAVGGSPIINSAPPPPATPTNLTPATFIREYHGTCPTGTRLVWQAFSWKADVPTGSSIVFTAQTAKDNAGAPGSYGLAVPVGSATSSTGTSFFTPATTVDQDLKAAAPPQTSEAWLRVTMKFNPNGPLSPNLTAWNQAFDCIPAE